MLPKREALDPATGKSKPNTPDYVMIMLKPCEELDSANTLAVDD